MSSDPQSLQPLDQGPSFYLYSFSSVLVMLWTGAVTANACSRVYQKAQEHSRSLDGGKLCVLSVSVSQIVPDAEAKEALMKLISDPLKLVHRSAVVHKSNGFVEATVRAVVLNLVTRLRAGSSLAASHRAFAELEGALEWLLENYPGPALSLGQRLRLVRELEAAMQAHR